MITAENVRLLFNYDPYTGEVSWKISPSRKTPFGKRAGGLSGKGYRYIRYAGSLMLEHRIIWLWMTGRWPEQQIDHINGNRTDNRWPNLREVDQTRNNMNMKARGKWKGISLDKRNGKWASYIKINKVRKFLGYFDCPAAAHLAYVVAASEQFGEYMRTT